MRFRFVDAHRNKTSALPPKDFTNPKESIMKKTALILYAAVLAVSLCRSLPDAATVDGKSGSREIAQVLSVPGDYPTIQACIDGAAAGDTCIVAPGTYVENVSFAGKAVTVAGESGPEETVIDGSGSATVVTFAGGELSDSVLDGFTIANGGVSGISCASSSPTITDCIVTGNSGSQGGGISLSSSGAAVSGCTITGNDATNGGGIYLWASSATITECRIEGNSAWAGGGIRCLGTSTLRPVFSLCTIKGNSADFNGGGIDCGSPGVIAMLDGLVASKTIPSAIAEKIKGYAQRQTSRARMLGLLSISETDVHNARAEIALQ